MDGTGMRGLDGSLDGSPFGVTDAAQLSVGYGKHLSHLAYPLLPFGSFWTRFYYSLLLDVK